jgi:hypothetical protein
MPPRAGDASLPNPTREQAGDVATSAPALTRLNVLAGG